MMSLFLCVAVSLGSADFELEDIARVEEIYRILDELRSHPIDLNTASMNDLAVIPFFTTADCLRIIEYREAHGSFRSLRDLMTIPGMDANLLEEIQPYVKVKQKSPVIERIRTRIRLQSDIPHTAYGEKWYTKTEVTARPYEAHLVTEKDPNELAFLDHCAPGLICKQDQRVFALGRYALDFGTGVMLSSSGTIFQAADFTRFTSERGIIPYTSVAENGGFFGAALQDSLLLKWTLFYSDQKLDGRVNALGNATSFYTSGLHTDSLSRTKKDRINEQIIGYDLHYRRSSTILTQRAYLCTYEPSFVCRDSLTGFFGDRFWVAGIGISHHCEPILMFSEVARSFRGHIGGLAGGCAYFGHFDISIASRYFPVGFYSPKGRTADDNHVGSVIAINNNSSIVKSGILLKVDNDLVVDSTKQDIRINVEKQVGFMNIKGVLRSRFVGDVSDISGGRLFLRARPQSHFFLDVRFEVKQTNKDGRWHRGLVGALEVGAEFKDIKCRLRYGLYTTDSYASRIYLYEIDLPGIIHNRMLYNTGRYGFIYCTVRPLAGLTVSAKLSGLFLERMSEYHVGGQVDLRW